MTHEFEFTASHASFKVVVTLDGFYGLNSQEKWVYQFVKHKLIIIRALQIDKLN